MDRSREYINRLQTHEAMQFLEKDYINGIFLAVCISRLREKNVGTKTIRKTYLVHTTGDHMAGPSSAPGHLPAAQKKEKCETVGACSPCVVASSLQPAANYYVTSILV